MAFEKFMESSIPFINDRSHLVAAAHTIYNDICLPEGDRKLKDALIDMWIVGSSELRANSGDFAEIRDFAADLSVRLLNGFNYNSVAVRCSKCKQNKTALRQVKNTNEEDPKKRQPV